MSAKQQLPPATEVLLVGLRNHAKGVLAGTLPASLPRPAPPEPVPPKLTVVAAPTTEVVALRNIRWVNAQGVVVVAGKLQRCHLPVKLVDEASRAGIVARVGDPRIRDQIGTWGMIEPLAANCEWVGPEAKPEPAPTTYQPAIPHSTLGNFQVVDRGPPVIGRMPVQPLAAGARKLDEEQ